MKSQKTLEIRWILPEGTTTERPILQFKENEVDQNGFLIIGTWRNVPVQIVSKFEFEESKRSLA